MATRVVVTVARGSLEGLDELLVGNGFEVSRRPLLSFAPPHQWGPVDEAVTGWTGYSDVVFTSPRAVEAFHSRLARTRNAPAGAEPGPTVWAGGPATTRALGDRLGPVTTVELRDTLGPGRALGETLAERGVHGPVLYLCGDPHREEFAAILREHGVRIDEVVCYRSMLAPVEEIRDAAQAGQIAVVGSPRVIDAMASSLDPGGRPRLVTLGPTTARTARNLSWEPAAVALSPEPDNVVRAVREAAPHE